MDTNNETLCCWELAPDKVNRCREAIGHRTDHYDGDRLKWPNTSERRATPRLDEKQVGGDHYKRRKITPWEIIDVYDLDFYAGNALKYLLRAKDKNGVEDLKKAQHYVEKLISKLEAQPPTAALSPPDTKTYKCPCCDTKFTTMNLAIQHMKKMGYGLVPTEKKR